MKKIVISLLVICLIFTFFTGCAVNSSTGLLIIANLSDKDTTIKIGDTSIFVAKGAKYDYWFTSEVKGKVASDDAEDVTYIVGNTIYNVKDEEATFKVNYVYEIGFVKMDGKYYIGIYPGKAAGKDWGDAAVSPY